MSKENSLLKRYTGFIAGMCVMAIMSGFYDQEIDRVNLVPINSLVNDCGGADRVTSINIATGAGQWQHTHTKVICQDGRIIQLTTEQLNNQKQH